MTESASTAIAISTWAVRRGGGAGPEFASSLQSMPAWIAAPDGAEARALAAGQEGLADRFTGTEIHIMNRVGNIELQKSGSGFRDRQLEPFPIGRSLDGTLEFEPEPMRPLALDAGFPLSIASEAELELPLSLPRRADDLAIDAQRDPGGPGHQKRQLELDTELGQLVFDPAAHLDRRPPHEFAAEGYPWLSPRHRHRGIARRCSGLDQNQVRLLEFLPELANVPGVVENDDLIGKAARCDLGRGPGPVIVRRRRLRGGLRRRQPEKQQRALDPAMSQAVRFKLPNLLQEPNATAPERKIPGEPESAPGSLKGAWER